MCGISLLMANRFLVQILRRISHRPLLFSRMPEMTLPSRYSCPPYFDAKWNFQVNSWAFKYMSHGRVNLVLSEGNPKFETYDFEPPKKEKWKTKKQLKKKRKKEKQRRKAANKNDPRSIRVKGKKKQKFQNAAERITYKIEKAKIKEAILVEKLKKYEVPPLQGPCVEPENLTGEERFYLKKTSQKRSNYAPIGRRGIFGGVIQNMHMHWKKHETVKVVCNKACKRGVVQEYAKEIARLSGGIPIQVIGNDTIVFYRGKNYVQPKEMIPIGTLSKKKALEKSKYEQSLETVRRFIAISEKELELYYRHVALYGDPNKRDLDLSSHHKKALNKAEFIEEDEVHNSSCEDLSDHDSTIEDLLSDLSDVDKISEMDDYSSESEIDSKEENHFSVRAGS